MRDYREKQKPGAACTPGLKAQIDKSLGERRNVARVSGKPLLDKTINRAVI